MNQTLQGDGVLCPGAPLSAYFIVVHHPLSETDEACLHLGGVCLTLSFTPLLSLLPQPALDFGLTLFTPVCSGLVFSFRVSRLLI